MTQSWKVLPLAGVGPAGRREHRSVAQVGDDRRAVAPSGPLATTVRASGADSTEAMAADAASTWRLCRSAR